VGYFKRYSIKFFIFSAIISNASDSLCEIQAADRTHRIGQYKPVFIYKFIARDTVEEKILQLQERKKVLVQQLIRAVGSFFKSITPEDVKVLFS